MKKLIIVSLAFLFFFLASANAADRAMPGLNAKPEKDSIPNLRHFQINAGFNVHGAVLFGGGEDTELRLGYFFRARGIYFPTHRLGLGVGTMYFNTYYTHPRPEWKKERDDWNIETLVRYYPWKRIYFETSYMYGGYCTTIPGILKTPNHHIATLSVGGELRLKKRLYLELDIKYFKYLEKAVCSDLNGAGFIGLSYYFWK